MFLVDARTEVSAFAEAMEDRLAEFDGQDGKCGLFSDDVGDLLGGIEDNLNEVYEEVNYVAHHADNHRPALLEACVDLANYAMMIADNLGALEDRKGDFPPESEIDPFEGIYDDGDVDPFDVVPGDEPPVEVEL